MTTMTFLTTDQLAARMSVSKKTLEAMRQKGTGPRYQKFGAKVLYSEHLLDEFLAKRTFASTAEYSGNKH